MVFVIFLGCFRCFKGVVFVKLLIVLLFFLVKNNGVVVGLGVIVLMVIFFLWSLCVRINVSDLILVLLVM